MKLVMCYIILHAESIKIMTNALKLERHNITINFDQNGPPYSFTVSSP